jgi:hypothetical protein
MTKEDLIRLEKEFWDWFDELPLLQKKKFWYWPDDLSRFWFLEYKKWKEQNKEFTT